MSGWAHCVKRISCRCFNLFLHTFDNVYEAVSSLLLGARASAALYAATSTCFFLKDCHEKTPVEAIAPLTPPPPQCWFGEPLVRNLLRGLSLYASFIAPPDGARLRESNTGDQSDLQEIPQDDQTPQIYMHTFQRLHCGLRLLQDRRGADGLCHVPVSLRRHLVVRFAALVGNLWYWSV